MGPQGPAGSNGSSNVQSVNVTATNNNWVYNTTENSYDVNFSVPAVTQSVLDGGTIQVFVGDGTSSQWYAIPSAYHNYQYNFDFQLGRVNIYVTLGNNAQPTNPGGVQFKIVVIPPASKSPNADGSDHEPVITTFTVS